MISDKNDLIVKSNRLIEASYRLTLVEQRMILAAIVEARESQTGLADSHVSLEARRFCELFGMRQDSVYGQLKEALDTLYQRSVTIEDVDPVSGKPRVSSFRWISSKSYISGAGTVQLRFSQEVVPYITRLEREFTSYRLERIGAMSSPNAIRVYELLLQYAKLGERTLETEELKRLLGLEGKYTKFSMFQKSVIDPSVDQINEFSDIQVSWKPRKTGRKFSHLVFSISYKAMKPASEAGVAAKQPPKTREQHQRLTDKEIAERGLAHPAESWEQVRTRLNGSPEPYLPAA